MAKNPITVLLIEDDPMVLAINRSYINQLDGFNIIGTASNGTEGIQLIRKLNPDLAIMDVYMPQQDGLKMLKQLRSEGYQTDIIMITAASDLETVKYALQYGAVDYIVKPFTFERIQQAFENYLVRHRQFKKKKEVTQAELDTMLFQLERRKDTTLPKGLNSVTLERIFDFLNAKKTSYYADEVAESLGIARVTARRYLEYLVQCGKAEVFMEYQKVGRPKNRYQTKRK
ncbi:response regulator [Bacillus sp. B15-48]|uniref:response regulator n=1 Tax=Bacillus sp. B15-48 TaxID=1548601 RepID=UPI00193F2042|nr:response regulator [Bacillus sp. B15-48]MBM4764641.1 response regulator [Bacillus sp. B15-48]